jgi:hypothetical protein
MAAAVQSLSMLRSSPGSTTFSVFCCADAGANAAIAAIMAAARNARFMPTSCWGFAPSGGN